MTIVTYAQKLTGTLANPSVATMTAPTVGDTVLVFIAVPTANEPITNITDNLGNSYVTDQTKTGLNGLTYYIFRKSNIGNAPTTLLATLTSGTYAAFFEVIHVHGLDNVSPLESLIDSALSSGAVQVTHSANFTTASTNAFVLLGSSTGGARNLNSMTSVSMTVVPTESGGSQIHAGYLADAGVAGSYSTTLTLSSTSSANSLGAVYKSATGPSITSVTSASNIEGSAIVHTVTLSTAVTGSPAVYTIALTDVTATGGGVDYTSTLTNGMFSNGVTVSGANISVPVAVSSFTVTVATTQDTLNEINETYTLTISGVSGTGTITNDDPLPSIAVSDAAQSGTTVTFNVTLSTASGKTITVDYVTANGSKTAGVDYTAASGTLTFTPGQTSKTVVVQVL